MSWWMNEAELRKAVRNHCGSKMNSEEKICKACAKKLSRAKKIEWQKKYLWKMKEKGLLHKLEGMRDDKQWQEHSTR